MKIDGIYLKIIPDSKGKDTLEAEMESGGLKVTASVPAGESTGKNEAKLILPKKALEKTDWIFSQTKDTEFVSLDQFDGLLNTLDGTGDKSSLGGNLIIALSTAFAKLLAKSAGMEVWQLVSKISGNQSSLPLCFYNVIEGGVHGGPSTSLRVNLPFQEYWFIPKTNSPKKSLDEVNDFLKVLGDKIKDGYGEVEMGSEGGYTIPSKNAEDGLKIMQEISSNAYFGLDVAATKLPKRIDLSYYERLTNNYELLAIEDPYSEEDWDGFCKATAALGMKVWIVGDDLTTTNVGRIKMAYQKKAINAVIIKPTQIGTVTETIQAANLAKSYGWKIIVSNRGEETMDDFIADLAVGLSADAIKSGCPLQKERLVKYQRLIEIEKSWGANIKSPLGCLVLVRHTESQWNKKGLWTGWTDIDLDEEGIQSAKKVGQLLKNIPFDLFFTSPLKRAEHTLIKILEELGKSNQPILANDSLKERNYGEFTGKNKWEIRGKIGQEEFLKIRRGWNTPIQGGESLKDVFQRVIPFYEDQILPKLKEGKNILIVSHGNNLRALVKYLENISDKDIPNLEIPTGEIIIYQINTNGKILSKQIKNSI